eukprot:CAMPEP_0204321598 /NCGR_PEP_ID=MMETSP0469-20131031/8247_1 /ASSEMBLY_ACC=CAM_ASM_000384 /TAXON_ID=2969 /ORGANISM="Oxyrrhis marina" /LENGTH=73 /DNA_ID=CAMNT_0051302905 /DNA_START=59 /DNA_END=276 /DNA_ORIENTATION=+
MASVRSLKTILVATPTGLRTGRARTMRDEVEPDLCSQWSCRAQAEIPVLGHTVGERQSRSGGPASLPHAQRQR